MSDTILVVDDDPLLLELIGYNLRGSGYNIITAADGQEGIRLFHKNHPELVILDIAMPKLDGFEVCQRIREVSDVPIIMLTAKGRSEEDIIKGLDLGADDYMIKPFRVGELLARIRATLRRARTMSTMTQGIVYSDGYLLIDLDARQVSCDGELVKLTPTEYKLLAYMVKNKGRWLEFRQILENVWGFEYIDDIDYLRVYIWHLRRKLEPDPKNPIYLLNELNVGYRFEPHH
jgi:two-component system KDP operon response regulator KdpE